MRFARNPDLISADMDGDLVMMSVEQGTYYGLTGIAPQIWIALEEPKTANELFDALFPQYDVKSETLRRDIDSFLEEMLKNKLLRAL